MVYILPWKRETLQEMWTWPHTSLFNLFGLWAEEASTEYRRRLLSYWRYIAIPFIISAELCVILDIVFKFASGNVTSSLFSVFIMEPSAAGVFKTLVVARNRKYLKRAMDMLDELTQETTNEDDIAHIKNKLFRIWIIYFLVVGLVVITVIHYYTRPLYFAIVYGERTRMLDTWPEFNDTWIQFTVSYFYHCGCTFFLAFAWTSFDNIFFCISEYLLCHIYILKKNFEKLNFKDNTAEEMIKLKKLFKYHKKVIQISRELKRASDSILIIQALSTTFIFCFGLFLITTSEDLSLNTLINIAESASLGSLYFYLSCWYSNEMTIQLLDLKTALYMSNWPDATLKQKKSLLLAMTRAVQPITFGGFLKVDLNTFIDVFKSTFSYYNFLINFVSQKI